MDLTRRRAAGLGAVAGFSWAAAFMVGSTALLRASHARWPFSGGPLGIFTFLSFFAPSAGEPGRWLYFWPAGALAGALVGLAARRLRMGPVGRVVTLWLTFFPAVAVSTAVELWLVALAASLRGHGFFPFWHDLVALPGAMLVFAYGTVIVSPVLAWPLLAAAITIEAWTRPASAGRAFLGQPTARWVTLSALGSFVVLGLAHLRLSWSEIPGGSWLAP